MGQLGIWQILIIAVVIVLLFGRGKISSVMGDVAKGIKSFKKGISEDEVEEAKTKTDEGQTIDHQATETVSANKAQEKSTTVN